MAHTGTPLRGAALASVLLLGAGGAGAQDPKTAAAAYIDANLPRFEAAALRIWELAEVGYQEVESVAILKTELE